MLVHVKFLNDPAVLLAASAPAIYKTVSSSAMTQKRKPSISELSKPILMDTRGLEREAYASPVGGESTMLYQIGLKLGRQPQVFACLGCL